MTDERGVRLLGAVLAASCLAALVAVDLAITGSSVALGPLFALAPLIACAVLPAGPTTAFGVAAIALAAASGWWNDNWAEAQQTVRVVDVTLISAAAVVVAVVRVRREHRYNRVAVIAEVAQKAILPTLPGTVGQVAMGVRYLSAAEDAVVGGDLYDCYHSESHVRFLVGDVRGKGIGAVEQAARVIRAFRQYAATESTLPAVAEQMSGYLAPFFDDEEFVTAVLVDATEPDRLTLVSCGHPPPLTLRDGAAALLEAPACLPLGLGDSYDGLTVTWQSGDRLLLYTDGLSEARDARGEFLPLLPLTAVLSDGSVEDSLERLLDTVREHVPDGRLTDDLAVMLLQNVVGAEPGGAERATGDTAGIRVRT